MSPENTTNSATPKIYNAVYLANTPKEFALIARRVQSLYVKAWLIDQGRPSDARDYHLSGDVKFEQECGLGLKSERDETGMSYDIRKVTLDIPLDHNPILVRVVQLALEEPKEEK